MRTDPRELHRQTFDLLVVGAGIQGAAIARDAAMRGLAVALVDARDVAAGTSSRSSRLVHGGLRYLRQGHVALVREALAERERLLRLAPHLVRPLPMLMPCYRGVGSPPWLVHAATWVYGRLAGRSTLPSARRLDVAAAVAAFPGLRTAGLRAGILFFDAATQDTRLTLANVLAAVAAGARVATHCEVVGVHLDGVDLRDRLTDATVRVQARHVVNATGPRVDALRDAFAVAGGPLVRASRGSHLVLAPRDGEVALAAFLPDRRIQFVVPHRDGTLCGTTEADDELVGDETGPPAGDVNYLLDALSFLLADPPRREHVLHAYAGWRALPRRRGPAGALHREAFTVVEPVACGTLHSVVGGKLTTHRSFADRVVRGIFGLGGPSPTAVTPLPGGDGPREVTDPLWWRYGSRVRLVRALLREDPGYTEPLCAHRPFLVAELVHALRHEGAMTFADVMLRRLVHSAGPCLQPDCLRRAYGHFVACRPLAVGAGATDAVAEVQREVAGLRGALAEAAS